MQIKRVLITGGTGLVGTRLSLLLEEKGCKVTHLSRKAAQGRFRAYAWDIHKKTIDPEAIKSADAIIHLAGAGVADKRWNRDRKKEIYDSRIDSTKLLFDYVKEHNQQLRYFISASAIGYYGWDSGEQVVDESSPKGEGFLANVVSDWEAEVSQFSTINIPHAMIRIGVVLSDQGGALMEIAKPIKYGIGAPLGSGKQYMSWIHQNDLCGMFIHCLENGLEGIFNGVAPHPVTNEVLTKALAKQLKKPLILPNVPKFALKIIVGEMADMLIGGNNVSSKKIEALGYTFQFSELNTAIEDLI